MTARLSLGAASPVPSLKRINHTRNKATIKKRARTDKQKHLICRFTAVLPIFTVIWFVLLPSFVSLQFRSDFVEPHTRSRPLYSFPPFLLLLYRDLAFISPFVSLLPSFLSSLPIVLSISSKSLLFEPHAQRHLLPSSFPFLLLLIQGHHVRPSLHPPFLRLSSFSFFSSLHLSPLYSCCCCCCCM